MITYNATALIGISLVLIAVFLIAFSRYRYWLVFMLGGMMFWSALELLRIMLQSLLPLSLLQGYISAFAFSLLVITLMIMIKDRQQNKNRLNKVNCIEHTPVYEDDSHTYSRSR